MNELIWIALALDSHVQIQEVDLKAIATQRLFSVKILWIMHKGIWFLQLEVYNLESYVNINELLEKFHQMYNDQSEQLEMKHIE